MTKNSAEGINFMLGGAVSGATISTSIGSMGLLGGFGGISLGLGVLAGAGAVTGAAAYGAFRAINEGDATAVGAIGLSFVGGAGVSAAVGGMGLSVGGTAIGVGMGTMAVAGGVVGLGIYGLAKMFSDARTKESIADTFERIEAKIVYLEAYNQALMELNPILSEIAWEQEFAAIELEEELQLMKKNFYQEAYCQETIRLSSVLTKISTKQRFNDFQLEEELQKMKEMLFENS